MISLRYLSQPLLPGTSSCGASLFQAQRGQLNHCIKAFKSSLKTNEYNEIWTEKMEFVCVYMFLLE